MIKITNLISKNYIKRRLYYSTTTKNTIKNKKQQQQQQQPTSFPNVLKINENHPIYKKSYDSLIEILNNKPTTTTTITTIKPSLLLHNQNSNETSISRFNFKNFSTLKFDIVFVSLKKNEPILGFVKNINDGTIIVQTNKKDLMVSSEDILLTIPTSHYRENREELFNEFLDNMKNISEFYGLSNSPLNNVRVELARNGFKELINQIDQQQQPNSNIDEFKLIEKLFQKEKDPYSLVINIADSFLTKIVKSKHFKQLSTQVYSHFSQFKEQTTKLDGTEWSEKQNHYDYIEITKVTEYCFGQYKDQIEMNGSTLKLNSWIDLFHHYCVIDMLSYYDSFGLFDSNYFYCLTGNYCNQVESEIKYLQNQDHAMDKKIFLKYCSKILMKIQDQSFKPNTYIHNDHSVPDIMDPENKSLLTKEMAKSFEVYINCLYRLLVISNFHSEYREIISNELYYPIKMSDLKQLEFLLKKLGKIDKNHFSIFEDRLKLVENKLIDPSSSGELFKIETIHQDSGDGTSRVVINDCSFSIDSESTLDIDDSVGLINEGNGEYSVIVHISDVTNVVKPLSNQEKWCQLKSSSIYLPHRTHFMIPNSITQHLSLSPDKSNKCLSFQFKVNSIGEIIDYKIFPSIVNNIIKTNYNKVDKSLNYIINGNDNGNDIISSTTTSTHSKEETNQLVKLYEISKLLKENRLGKSEQSKLLLNLPKVNIKYNDKFKSFNIYQQAIGVNEISNQIVSELMIATGYITSLFSIENGLHIPFRVQEKLNIDGLDSSVTTTNIDQLHPISSLYIASKSQTPSEMTLNNIGHYSLSLDNYTWCTSPIRRFPDILVHSQIKSWLKSKQQCYSKEHLESILPTLNKNLKSIKKLQRNCEKEYISNYLLQQTLVHGSQSFRAIQISNYSTSNRPFSIFCLLDYGLYEVYITEDIPISNEIFILKSALNYKHQLKFTPIKIIG